MLSEFQKKIASYYIILQIIIWVKSFVFFYYFGHGKVSLFSIPDFPKDLLLFDFVFHTLMHVLIGILALFYGARIEKLELKNFFIVIFVAVFLHNIAYWLTFSHQNIYYSVYDFFADSAILSIFVLAGFAIKKLFFKNEIFA